MYLFGFVVIMVVLVSFVYIAAVSLIYSNTPEEAIQKKLGNVKIKYKIINENYFDQDGSQRFYINELNGKLTDNIPHIFYLKKTNAGWYITNSGNALNIAKQRKERLALLHFLASVTRF